MHRGILRVGCVLLEPGLKLFLYMNQWLNAFVALERATAVFKGINFNKRTSRRIARWVHLFLPFVVLGSMAHEPRHSGNRWVRKEPSSNASDEQEFCLNRRSVISLYDS